MSHPLIKYNSLCYHYPGGAEALKDINLTVTQGERIALLGLNGSGKSTLLQLTDALIFPTSGEVNIGGLRSEKKTAGEIRRKVGLVFQNPDDMLFMPTIYEDVAFGPRNMMLQEEEVDRRVRDAVREVGLEGMEDRGVFQLSGGEKRRAAIAAVLAMEPSILLLDEPSANLDARARKKLIKLLSGFKHTIILATHDLDMARRLCERAVILQEGRIIADDNFEKIYHDKNLLEESGIL